MVEFSKTISIRWADLDPNFHLRHSVYYDFGAQFRFEIIDQLGLTTKVMQEQGFGPVIIREECVFKKEIRFSETIIITAKIARIKADISRWTFQHEFLNTENQVCAILTIDGAWMDTVKRKLASPTPQIAIEAVNAFPKTNDFILF